MNYRKLFEESKHHFATIVFVFGFVFDYITLPDPGAPLSKFLGFFYIGSLILCLLAREYVVSLNRASKLEQQLYSFLTLCIALVSGAFLSFVLIYYFRSAELIVSWPLFIVFIGIILFNEFISSHSFRFMLDLAVLFSSLAFFSIFNLPIFLNEQNDTVFVLSVLLAMFTSFLFLFLLSFSSEVAKVYSHKAYALAVGIPITVMVLYFNNIIPAVPLSLNQAGVYHAIEKVGDTYLAKTEVEPFYQGLLFLKPKEFHYDDSQGVYFFSSVKAPTELKAPLSHVWEYYDEKTKSWIETTVIKFPITGGREDGFRAYSEKNNLTEGLWRVSVRSGERRVVGRMQFKAIKAKGSIETKQIKL
jgi:hypothetical protein